MAAAKKTAKTEAPSIPFPFVGAGVPSPFEWIGYEICFEREPDAAVRAELVSGFPTALGARLEGARLSLSGGAPELHAELAEAVGERPNASGFASTRALRSMASAVEQRLVTIHARSPIQFALALLDAESDPPKRSKWHTASAKRIPSLLEASFSHVLTAPSHPDVELVDQLLTYAAMSQIKLPPAWVVWSEPARRVVTQLGVGNVEGARTICKAYAGNRIFVFHLQTLLRAITRDGDGAWATSLMRKWPQDAPWDAATLADWASNRPRFREGCVALAADIAAAAAPITVSDLACRDEILPALATLAVEEGREDSLLSDAFRAALAETLPYERDRFIAHLGAPSVKAPLRARCQKLAAALAEPATK